MADPMRIPRLEEAMWLMADAEERNLGPWVSHSAYTAEAARAIARHHDGLDPQATYILGYLHDIGRREGISDMRHVIDGHRFLGALGYDDAARICLTHSFAIQDVRAVAGVWDCARDEIADVRHALRQVEYTEYDRLIQLCDALALPAGYCLIEKRLVDVALRRGVNRYTVARWTAYLELQRTFEASIGRSIYSLLPGVVESTFGINLVS